MVLWFINTLEALTHLPEMARDLIPRASRNQTSVAFDRLRAAILSGELRPQERLRIQALGERYEVGATAIREALSRLVTDGFVESEDQRGFYVAPVSHDELMDLTHTRVQLEQLALRMAIEKGGVEWESSLLASYHRLSRTPAGSSPDVHAAWAQAHRQFHESVHAGCGSPWMMRLWRLLFEKSERYRNLSEHYDLRSGADEHRALLDAALARDVDAACTILSNHILKTADVILKAGVVRGKAATTPARGDSEPPEIAAA